MASPLRCFLAAVVIFAICTLELYCHQQVSQSDGVLDQQEPNWRLELKKSEVRLKGSLRPWDLNDTSKNWQPDTHILQVLPQLQPNVTCSPSTFGLSALQAASTFLQKKPFHPCCSYSRSFFSYLNDTITVSCSSSSYDILVGRQREEERLGDVYFNVEWKRNPGPTVLGESEFAFLRCGLGAKEALLVNKFNSSAASRAHKIAQQLAGEVNATEYKPIAVYLLILDSVSRQHFYRSFPETTAFLRSSNMSVFDFGLNHASGENTAPNMIPMLYGLDIAHLKELLGGLSHVRIDHAAKFLEMQSAALWEYMKANGFVTLFGYDTVWDFLSPYIGREVSTDHMISNFYHAAKKVFGYNEFSNSQRCIGCHNAHYYPLQYLLQFHNNYSRRNRFAYLHLSPGHESSGTVIRSADPDVRALVQQLADSEDDVVLLLASDHGLHVGAWDEAYEGFVENQLPLHLMCISKALMRRLGPDTHRILLANTQRLVTRYDWHLTLRHLATLPYGQLSSTSLLYESWKDLSDNKHAVSLLLEEVPATRSCSEAGLPVYYCACLSFHEYPQPPAEALALATDFLNWQTSNVPQLCLRLNALDIMKAYIHEGKNTERYIKIRFRVKELAKARFDAVLFWASADRFRELHLAKANNEHQFASVGGEMLQIRELKRADEYAGVCEHLAKAFGAIPSLCICKQPFAAETLENKPFRQLIEQVLAPLRYIVPGKGSSCSKACESEGRSCAEWALTLLNDERLLRNRTFSFLREEMRSRVEDLEGVVWKREGVGVRLRKTESRWELLLAEWSRPPFCDDQAPATQPLCACF